MRNKRSFRSDDDLRPSFWTLELRVIPADIYLKKFASDQSHMTDSDGNLQVPPPTYPCIDTPDSKMNLNNFICMDARVGYGEVYELSDFVRHFGVK